MRQPHRSHAMKSLRFTPSRCWDHKSGGSATVSVLQHAALTIRARRSRGQSPTDREGRSPGKQARASSPFGEATAADSWSWLGRLCPSWVGADAMTVRASLGNARTRMADAPQREPALLLLLVRATPPRWRLFAQIGFTIELAFGLEHVHDRWLTGLDRKQGLRQSLTARNRIDKRPRIRF